nr:hypothetical protein 16 [Moraxellaceae bacterium]
MELQIFEAVRGVMAMGGDVGVMVLAWALWKFDRRLIRLETKIGVG